jgi:flavin reductase (DIM6/NTAB) family NADH-FMN oxidoreductase RutF
MQNSEPICIADRQEAEREFKLSTSLIQRNIFRRFQCSVVVLTVHNSALDVGMTISSLVSVSLEPSLVSVCLAKQSMRALSFLNAREIAVHILSEQEFFLAEMFAISGIEPFESLGIARTANGTPILSTRGSVLIGRPYSIVDAGDHWIQLIELVQLSDSDQSSLTYVNGTYQQIEGSMHS